MQADRVTMRRGWLKGFGTGAGADMVIELLALSSASGSASPAVSFRGDHATYGNTGFDFSGCGKSSTPHAKMSAVTGTGHADMKTSAKTCSPSNGGPVISSYGVDFVQYG